MHPGGGTAYAVLIKLKIIEQWEGGRKPNMMALDTHKSELLPIMQWQESKQGVFKSHLYMRLPSAAHVGGWF